MKFINPSVEYLPQPSGIQGIWHQIATATRVCYQSQAREGESDEDFVKRVLFKPALIEGDLSDLKNCKFNILKLHGGCLEQGTVYLTNTPYINKEGEERLQLPASAYTILNYNPYTKTYVDSRGYTYFTTNVRVLVENDIIECLDHAVEPTIYHYRRYGFRVITDIGVTREFNRHRSSMSICEESTRYCDYTKDKFSGELTFIKPAWWKQDNTMNPMLASFQEAEQMYQRLRKHGWKPEQARQILPLGLKTEAIYTAFVSDWKHFLALRSSKAVSGAPHPNIRLIADKIAQIAEEQDLWQIW